MLFLNNALCVLNKAHYSKYCALRNMSIICRNLLSLSNKSRVVESLKENSDRIVRGGRRRQAAVLVPMFTLTGQDSPELLFTLRSSTLSQHRSQVSFPGGIVEDGDASLVETALRETKEELGIDPDRFSVWGCLPALPDRNGESNIVPVLASTHDLDPSNLQVNEDEVEKVFHLSFEHLSNPHNQSYTLFKRPVGLPYPVFHGGPIRIWGLTAFILDIVLHTMLPSELNYSLISTGDHQRKR